MADYRVLFHLDDCSEARTRMTLENIMAIIEEAGTGAVEVELLANGAGVLSLIKRPNPFRLTIEKLSSEGVGFSACRRSMRTRGVVEDDLLPVVAVVPSGVLEIVQKQVAGWVYIRP